MFKAILRAGLVALAAIAFSATAARVGAFSSREPGFLDARDDVARRLAAAGARGQRTLVDFFADGCVSCHAIEREVFGDPRGAAALGRMQVLRPDVTANDATDQALVRAWHVAALPTLLLVRPDGRDNRELRIVGEIDAADFLARLDRVLGVTR